MMVYNVATHTGHAATGIALITLWSLAWVSIAAQGVLTHLFVSGDLRTLALLPAPMPLVFRWEMWKWWRASPGLLTDLLAGYAAMGVFWDEPAKWMTVVPAALGSWAAMHALALFCAARFRRIRYPMINAAIFIMSAGLVMGHQFVGGILLDLLDQAAPAIDVLLPSGWVPSLLLLTKGTALWAGPVLVLGTGAILYSAPSSLKRLRKGYKFGEPVLPQASDILPRRISSRAESIDSESRLRVGPTVIEEIISRREFLAEPAWPQNGWLEKRLWAWLDPREKVLSDFAFAGGVAMTQSWKKIFRNTVIMLVAVFVTGFTVPEYQLFPLIGGLVVTVLQVLGQIILAGTAFRRVFCSGVIVPFYAVYGIGFRELSRFLLKCTVIQVPLTVLFAVMCCGAIVCVTKQPFVMTFLLTLKAAGLLLASRFIFLVFHFSSTTNDFTFRSIIGSLLLLVLLACGAAFLLFAIACMAVPNSLLAWFFWVLALGSSYLFFWIYGLIYRYGKTDLMKMPRRS